MKKYIHWETVADCSFDYWNNPDKVRKDDLIKVITNLINVYRIRKIIVKISR